MKMAEVVGISPAQLRYVTNTLSGMGLIKCGTVVIPFDNQISKETDLYKLYNTNIHEKIAEMKAKEPTEDSCIVQELKVNINYEDECNDVKDIVEKPHTRTFFG